VARGVIRGVGVGHIKSVIGSLMSGIRWPDRNLGLTDQAFMAIGDLVILVIPDNRAHGRRFDLFAIVIIAWLVRCDSMAF
jgi:hypothetical protein